MTVANQTAPNQTTTPQPNRFSGILIVTVIALPMLLAYLMFHTGWGIPASTSNKGILLQVPQSVSDLRLENNHRALANLYSTDRKDVNQSEGKKWRLLVPMAADCQEACQQNLYLTRQVHIRLAEKAYRVERILLPLAAPSSDLIANLEQEHPGVRLVESRPQYLASWLAGVDKPEDHYYLVDQSGFAMMRYNSEHSGQDLLDDIKKVLKYTYDK